MRTVSIEKLIDLQSRPENIRNICILAHVDHGKTTLADSLVAANGIISSRMVGKLRYMDSRPDEQERGITMKSSAIALYHAYQSKDYLINLIDSPGHIDFCGEVSTATRMCDGALIIIDVVEGVCPQTHAVLRQAWREGIRPLLVLNKIDRLITELKMTTMEAYRQLERVLEEVNAVAGGLFLSKLIDRDEDEHEHGSENGRQRRSTSGDYTTKDDDEDIYFSPESGNVLFSCAVDGWGFRLDNFVALCSQKTGIDEASVRRGLWGDYYLDSKSKTIRNGAFDQGKKPVFVQMILDTVWTAYQAILIKKDKEMTEKILKSLNIAKLPPSKQQDPKVHLQSVMSQWLPLAESVLSAVCQLLPSPDQVTDERVVELICSGLDARPRSDTLSDEAKRLKKHIRKCDSGDDVPVVVFVSKMFAVERSQLPENRRRPMTAEQLQALRVARQQRLEDKKVQFADGVETALYHVEDSSTTNGSSEQNTNDNQFTFMAFARVFSGMLRPGQHLYLVSANSSGSPGAEIASVTIDRLYLMMGRELDVIDQAPAGNVIAIGGLEDVIFKTATLSSTPDCPPLAFLRFYAHPIVRVSVEPMHPIDMPKLVRALKLLNQTDPGVKTYVQDTGEHVLVTAGEVHLQRCLSDLRERFSDIELNVSEPIIPFHETIVAATPTPASIELGVIDIKTANKRMSFKIRAKPLSLKVVDVMERYELILKNIETLRDSQLDEFRIELKKAFDEDWEGAVDRLWSFGPKKARCNVLLNWVPSYSSRPSFWSRPSPSELRDFDQSVISGFQLRCQSGPLCDEPIRGVAFLVEEWVESGEGEVEAGKMDAYGPMSGQVIAAMKEGCKLAFQAQPQRLSMAMYSCLIQATSEVLGRVYAVLSRRGGRVLKEEVKEGTNLFEIEATLPVFESFGFADDIRTRTSGLASPQLVFSHWEVLDLDPFWVPNTEEELSHYGDKSDTENRALKYMNAVRRRKGLMIDEKTVEHAEKQRTLARKV